MSGPGSADLAARWLITALPFLVARSASAQAPPPGRDQGTIVIVVGAEANLPVPTLSNFKSNVDVQSLLFLRLANPPKTYNTTDESQFEPLLARSWTRRDSITLVFELDPRARWHDGKPVIARDVVWSVDRARDPTVSQTYALLLRNIASVSAESERRVVVKYKRAYREQLYDVTFHAPPLPSHLLDTIPKDKLATSAFVGHPVGSGPFKWGRNEPGRQLELVANPDFFLGAPKLARVVLLVARDAEAQLNLVLDGTADAFEPVMLASMVPRVVGQPTLRLATAPSFTVGFLLFNQRAYGDRSRPHPILADPEARRAIAMAIDRQRIVRATFGPYAKVADGPAGQAAWIRRELDQGSSYDPRAARALLESRGWRDQDGDGYLERDTLKLTLRLNFPGTSIPRVTLAQPIQEMLRQVGVRLELVRLDGPVWAERRGRGEFDLDFSQTIYDPAPSGLAQSLTCLARGGSNVAQYCNPTFDSLLALATNELQDPRGAWQRALRTLQRDVPAVYLYSPIGTVVLHARYRNVRLRSDQTWGELWRWSVDPAQRLPRDGGPAR